MNMNKRLVIAERIIHIAEKLLEKEALTEQMQSKLLDEVDRVKYVVMEEGVTVEEAMDLVFGRGFKVAYPDWYDKIVKYVTEMLQAMGRKKKKSCFEKVGVVRKCKEEDKESSEDVWCVYSEKGRLLGRYSTKEEAEKRLRQVEYFKHRE